MPEAGLTAWQALVPAMPLEGKRVLVHGGAGGVGGFAVQIAKAHGAHVTTTCSSRNVDLVTQEFGADVAMDYSEGPWHEAVGAQRFDAVIDTIGGSYEPASLRLIARGGFLASLGGSGPDNMSLQRPLGVAAFLGFLANALARTALGRLGLGPRFYFVMQDCAASKGLEQIAALMAEGKIKVHFDRVWPLEEMVAAHNYCEGGHTRGKVGILVKKMD